MVLVSWVVSVNWVEVQPLPKIPGKFHDTFVMVPWGPSSSLRSHYSQVPCDGRHQAPNHIFEEKVQIHDVAQMQKKTVITEPRDLYTPWDIYYLCIE